MIMNYELLRIQKNTSATSFKPVLSWQLPAETVKSRVLCESALDQFNPIKILIYTTTSLNPIVILCYHLHVGPERRRFSQSFWSLCVYCVFISETCPLFPNLLGSVTNIRTVV